MCGGVTPAASATVTKLGEQLDLATSELPPTVTFQGAIHQCLRFSLDIVTLKPGVRSAAHASPDAFRAQSGRSSDIGHQNLPPRERDLFART
jgi:hypothetical protein